jgi:hypothetical protein
VGECAVRVPLEPDVVAEDDVGGDPALVLAHVGEQRASVDVADCVEPVDARDAQRLVDLERPVRLEPDRLQPELAGCRSASDGDEQLVADKPLARVELDRDGAVSADASSAGSDAHLDVACLERLLYLCCSEGLLGGRSRVGPPPG